VLTVKRALFLLALALAGSGCVSPQGYFRDRWADTKDIFTASVGTGGGARARVGPLNAGLFLNSDLAGLRGGECFRLSDGPLIGGDSDAVLLLFYGDQFDLRYPPVAPAKSTSPRPRYQVVSDTLAERNKCFRSGIMPLPSPLTLFELPKTPYYYTQLEVAVGVGGTLRLGFNPGEVLDFLLGWTTLDIFRDDREARREREADRRY
jgi:hypothetical protein